MHARRVLLLRPLFFSVAVLFIVMTALALVRWNLWTYGSDT